MPWEAAWGHQVSHEVGRGRCGLEPALCFLWEGVIKAR